MSDRSSETGEEGGRSRVYSAPAIEKAIDVLELLGTEPGGLTISEMAQRLGRSISELFRMIVVLEQRRWLQKGLGSDRYRVTYRMLEVAFRATPAQELALVAAPAMHDLAADTSQSCHLVVRGEARGMIVHRQENLGPVGFAMRLGASVDLITSCSGHVLLAFAPEAQRDDLIHRLPHPSGYSLDRLRQRLRVVRLQGYEMQPSARTAGVTDISYPVFGFDGNVAAALTIPFLMMIDGSQRTDLEETRQRLQDATRRISAELGCPAS
ncbi:DNA-binding IclR family transcriptional regulator [Sphingomonas insulae]|uniref:IclR family transcriptional regulator n=1 Tax=Sphingomonas insulae TaxID=424800 RepID=A0ABN1HZ92_9SPHN|nr:IclR family transcriptional regulator [Sphingomonas insulae]NIJ31111.1 DNA-binding IclR family transcriptional regulator [Sphingomonas insulae]